MMLPNVNRIGLACLLALLVPAISKGEEDSSAVKVQQQRLRSLQVTDIAGKKYAPFREKKVKAVALIFVSTDCPVANAFQPALSEFQKKYAPKGIRSFMIYCSPKLTKQEIAKHVKDFGIRMPAIHDADQGIGKLTQAKVTPEAIVVDRSGKVRYRGMINNLYAGYGKKRAAATRHYLCDACDSIVLGKDVKTKATKPLGCFIHYEKKQEPAARGK